MNFVSGGDQEAAKWDRAAAGRKKTEASEAALWRRHRWLLACDWLINVNTELWLVADTMTQSARPGYSDTKDREEQTNALREKSENLEWIWVVTWIFHIKFELFTWILAWNMTSPE